MSWYEQAFGTHYRLLYQHRDEGEARRCLNSLPGLAPLGDGPVLDLACGDGRHLASLAAAGTPAVGLDLSAELLAVARQRDAGLHAARGLIRGDMRRLPLRDGAVTSVLSLFTSFGYFGGLADHDELVAEVARVLRPRGHWFLDYLNCRAVRLELERTGKRITRREVGPCAVHESRCLGKPPSRVFKAVSLRPLPGYSKEAAAWGVPAEGLEYTEEVALFELEEMDRLAATHDLLRVAAAGSYEGDALDPERSPRWLLVYQRDGRDGNAAAAET